MHTLSDSQAQTLFKISIWWKDELLKKGKTPELDKRLDWMMNILAKKKYSDNAKQFLNQMRDLYLGKPQTPKSSQILHQPKPFRSTVNVGGFPMV